MFADVTTFKPNPINNISEIQMRLNLFSKFALALACTVILSTNNSLLAQDVAEKQTEATPALDLTISSPPVTEKHKLLFRDLGTWDCDITMYMGPEPTHSKGVEVNHRQGKYWMISNFSYEFQGQKVRGHGQFGYDESKDKFVGTWIDSLSPQLSIMEGDYDKETKTMTYNFESKDPDGQLTKMRLETVMVDQNNRKFTMSMANPADESQFIPIMTTAYTKRTTDQKQEK